MRRALRATLVHALLIVAALASGCAGLLDAAEPAPSAVEAAVLMDGPEAFRVLLPAGAAEAAAAFTVIGADGAPVLTEDRAAWNVSAAGGHRVETGALAPGTYEARVLDGDGRVLTARAFTLRAGAFASLAPADGGATHAFRLSLEEAMGARERLRLDLGGNLTTRGDAVRATGAGSAEGVWRNVQFEGSVPRFAYAAVAGTPSGGHLDLEGVWQTTGDAPPAEGTLRGRTELLGLEACPAGQDARVCRHLLDVLHLEGHAETGSALVRFESHNVTHRWAVHETGATAFATWEEWTNRTMHGQTDRQHQAGEAAWGPEDAQAMDGGIQLDAAFDVLGAWPARAVHPWPLQPGDRLEARLGNATWTWHVEAPDADGGADAAPTVRVVGATEGARALLRVALDGEHAGVAVVATLQEERGGTLARLTTALDAGGA